MADFEIDEEPEEELVERVQPSTVPASAKARWTNLETSYIDVRPELSHVQAYEVYLRDAVRRILLLCERSVHLRKNTTASCQTCHLHHLIFFLFQCSKWFLFCVFLKVL